MEGARHGEQEPAGRPPAPISGMVGRGAELRLVNGSTRRGFVYAVDPETGCVLLLVKSQSDAQTDAWSVSAAMPGSIASFSGADLGGAEAFCAAISACPLVTEPEGDALSLSAEEVGERRGRLVELLRLHRLDVSVCEGDAVLSVLGGLVRVSPPYTAESSSSNNDMVLQQIAALIAKLDQA